MKPFNQPNGSIPTDLQNSIQLLYWASVVIDALHTKTEAQKAWLSQYHLFGKQLSNPAFLSDLKRVSIALNVLLERHARLDRPEKISQPFNLTLPNVDITYPSARELPVAV